METSNLRTVLDKLKQRRKLLREQLDNAYLREDVTTYISLDERYKRLAHSIDKLLYRLKSRGSKSRRFRSL